jgi:hypothetical protein
MAASSNNQTKQPGSLNAGSDPSAAIASIWRTLRGRIRAMSCDRAYALGSRFGLRRRKGARLISEDDPISVETFSASAL